MSLRLTSTTNDIIEVGLADTKIFKSDNIIETEKDLGGTSGSGNTPTFQKPLSEPTLLENFKHSSTTLPCNSCVEVDTNPGMSYKCGCLCTEPFPVCRPDSKKTNQNYEIPNFKKTKLVYLESFPFFLGSGNLVLYKNSHVAPRFGCEKRRAVSMPNTLSTQPNKHLFQETTKWSILKRDFGVTRSHTMLTQIVFQENTYKKSVFTPDCTDITHNMDLSSTSRTSCTNYTSNEDRKSGTKLRKLENPYWVLKCDSLIEEKKGFDTPKSCGEIVSKSDHTQLSTIQIGTYKYPFTSLDVYEEAEKECLERQKCSNKFESTNNSHPPLCINGVSLWMLKGMYSQVSSYSLCHVKKRGQNEEWTNREERSINHTTKHGMDSKVSKLNATEAMKEPPYLHDGFLGGLSRFHVASLRVPLKAPTPKVPINISQLVLSLE